MKVSVIGAGSWGTALAHLLGTAGNDVMLWARKPEVCEGINELHRNPRYLVDSSVSERVRASSDYETVLHGSQGRGHRDAIVYHARRRMRYTPVCERGCADYHLLEGR